MPRNVCACKLLMSLILAVLVCANGGCRNRCGPCIARPFALSPRIPAPGTNAWLSQTTATPTGGLSPTALSQSVATTYPQPHGVSQIVAPQFNTISYDPRMDPTRLAVSDASQVAAPAALGIAPNAGPLAQALYRGQVPTGNAPVNVRQGTFEYLTAGRSLSGNPTYMASAPQLQNPYQHQVLAQGTTLSAEQNPNYQNGWRSPSQSAGATSVNR